MALWFVHRMNFFRPTWSMTGSRSLLRKQFLTYRIAHGKAEQSWVCSQLAVGATDDLYPCKMMIVTILPNFYQVAPENHRQSS